MRKWRVVKETLSKLSLEGTGVQIKRTNKEMEGRINAAQEGREATARVAASNYQTDPVDFLRLVSANL